MDNSTVDKSTSLMTDIEEVGWWDVGGVSWMAVAEDDNNGGLLWTL